MKDIVTLADDETKFRFHHNRIQAVSTISLLQEFKRLSLNKLRTRAQTIIEFMGSNKNVSFIALNVQSLRKHSIDLNDSVTQKSNFLLLSETWLDNEEQCELPNFDCIAKFQRDSVRAGGVGIYYNKNDKANIVTSNMDLILKNFNALSLRCTNVGDICSAECVTENGINFIKAVIYVSSNQKNDDIAEFFHRSLLEYSKSGSAALNRWQKNLHRVPLILAGDFNVNFADKKKSESLLKFLSVEFDLTINNNPSKSTTRYNTTIDAVFSRYIEKIQSQTYVTYFNYHTPIVTVIKNTD